MKRIGTLARLDPGRLRLVLTLFFLALAIPTAVLVYQAHSQLEWETFEQHRGMAEELSARVGSRVNALIEQEETRSVADYQFLVLAGDPMANFLQRSPLSGFPVNSDIPGLIGYFDVDSDGRLTTPLLPPDGTDVSAFGVGPDEYAARLESQRTIETVLTEGRLVRSRVAEPVPSAVAGRLDVEAPGADSVTAVPQALPGAARSSAFSSSDVSEEQTDSGEVVFADEPAAEDDARLLLGRLRQAKTADSDDERDYKQTQTANLGRVGDLALDDTLEEKRREVEDQRSAAASTTPPTPSGRVRRKEQITLPQTAAAEQSARTAFVKRELSATHVGPEKRDREAGVPSQTVTPATAEPTRRPYGREDSPAESATEADTSDIASAAAASEISIQTAGEDTDRDTDESAALGLGPGDAGQTTERAAGALRIMTFESEIDPFEFSLLDSGHFVLFRRVWRDGQRQIQGALIEQRPFLDGLFEPAFRATTLSRMSDLIIAFGDDVFAVFADSTGASYLSRAAGVSGALLFRGRLPAPLDGLEMVFSFNELPTGPGGRLIRWVTLILATVLLGGLYLLYRLGIRQIALARQQQDFVSAVSHELKTPLTSIRMYGEMLRSGWADEEKKRSYYDYIHDESERLSRLIDNVLQLARLTRSDPHFDPRAVSAGELLDTTRSKIEDHVHLAGFELEIQADDAIRQRMVKVDTDCFIQIVINLVENALKFASGAERKLIRIGAESGAEGKILFTVRDFGPGIPRDQRRKIFRLFYRSEDELTRETVGTGIGLALVHQLTLAMHGSVDVRNRDPGAEFRVSLPPARD